MAKTIKTKEQEEKVLKVLDEYGFVDAGFKEIGSDLIFFVGENKAWEYVSVLYNSRGGFNIVTTSEVIYDVGYVENYHIEMKLAFEMMELFDKILS